jgi:hypothetical protein
MNIKDLIAIWLKKHEISGNKAWFDGKTYYSLTIEQIRGIVNYVTTKSSIKEGGEE